MADPKQRTLQDAWAGGKQSDRSSTLNVPSTSQPHGDPEEAPKRTRGRQPGSKNFHNTEAAKNVIPRRSPRNEGQDHGPQYNTTAERDPYGLYKAGPGRPEGVEDESTRISAMRTKAVRLRDQPTATNIRKRKAAVSET